MEEKEEVENVHHISSFDRVYILSYLLTVFFPF